MTKRIKCYGGPCEGKIININEYNTPYFHVYKPIQFSYVDIQDKVNFDSVDTIYGLYKLYNQGEEWFLGWQGWEND